MIKQKSSLLAVCQAAYQSSNDHGGSKASNEQLSDCCPVEIIVLIKCINKRPLKPVTSYVQQDWWSGPHLVEHLQTGAQLLTHHEGIHNDIIVSKFQEVTVAIPRAALGFFGPLQYPSGQCRPQEDDAIK